MNQPDSNALPGLFVCDIAAATAPAAGPWTIVGDERPFCIRWACVTRLIDSDAGMQRRELVLLED